MTASWQNKTWRQRIFLILTIIVVVMLMMHPELRIFLPLLDALGLELLLTIMASQVIKFVRPGYYLFVRYVTKPTAAKLYTVMLFLFGVAGPYFDAWVTEFIVARRPVALGRP